MELTEAQQDGIVLEYTLFVAQQREVMERHRAVLSSLEKFQPAFPAVSSNTNGVRPRRWPQTWHVDAAGRPAWLQHWQVKCLIAPAL